MDSKNLLILDLEATCHPKGTEPRGFCSEIIGIGAVLLDSLTFKTLDTFDHIVKPVLFPLLSPFCIELTTITQEMVDKGISIQSAVDNLANYQKQHDFHFASWGFYDKKQIDKTCQQFKLKYPFNSEHISLKHEYAKFFRSKPLGMNRALKLHKLPLKGIHHRGIDDAINISTIAIHMIKNGWTPKFLNSKDWKL